MLVGTKTHWREVECLPFNSCQLWACNTARHLFYLLTRISHLAPRSDKILDWTEHRSDPIRQSLTCLLRFSHLPPTEINAPAVRYLASYQGTINRKATGLLREAACLPPKFQVYGGLVGMEGCREFSSSTKLYIRGCVGQELYLRTTQSSMKTTLQHSCRTQVYTNYAAAEKKKTTKHTTQNPTHCTAVECLTFLSKILGVQLEAIELPSWKGDSKTLRSHTSTHSFATKKSYSPFITNW